MDHRQVGLPAERSADVGFVRDGPLRSGVTGQEIVEGRRVTLHEFAAIAEPLTARTSDAPGVDGGTGGTG
ncbi:hypothetical protein O7606_01290 [Micromonospora sp. WMMD882]|uniref:hypothetical protein n=1 Tax=Micromonospora sp. WMMD882 TaxID=3015151 RepID=UPI00248A9655|nr:hypothetical protein [Micromonospora sp. WMMD882]WBB80062.1 hypothetical protein O7606_01290 [Micromonospora sp. WMMD882]